MSDNLKFIVSHSSMPLPSDSPINLMFDLRERMVRIETKLDGDRENHSALSATVDEHTKLLAALHDETTINRTAIQTLRWVAGIVVAASTLLFGSGFQFHW